MVIIAALSIEISPLLNALSAKKIKAYSHKTGLYKGRGYDLLITGVGPLMAERTLISYLDEYRPKHMLNIGTAGMLSSSLILGKTYHVGSVITKHEAAIPLSLLTGEKGEICLSVKRAVEESDHRDESYSSTGATLADMECYTVAKIAKKNNIPISAIKVTSDYANFETADMFKKHIEKCALSLAEEVMNILEQRKETT